MRTFPLFLLFLCVFSSAQAMEALNFDSLLSLRSQKLIEQKIGSDVQVAEIDLNRDNIFDFIARPNGCNGEKLCEFRILAEIDDDLIDLGSVQAYKIVAGNYDDSGLRSLMVFQNSENDFDYTLYRWDFKTNQYRMTQKQD